MRSRISGRPHYGAVARAQSDAADLLAITRSLRVEGDLRARRLVEHIEQELSETGGESELAFWRRRVAQSCIYGVDLNPLAVDLAQLSLWLATVAKDRPLSFLDHHLRCGKHFDKGQFAPNHEQEPCTQTLHGS